MVLPISSGKDSAIIKPSPKDQGLKTHIHIMPDATGSMSESVKEWMKTPNEINSIIANGGGQGSATPASTKA